MPDTAGLKMEVEFEKSFSALNGTLKWSDLSPYAMPLKNIEIDGRKVKFELEAGPSLSIFDGERISTDSIKGAFSQRNAPSLGNASGEFSLELKETTVEPSDPIEEPVELETNAGSIYGTLLAPDVWKPPIALLVSGPVSSDRDGNLSTLQLDTIKLLAMGLLNHGIATLRFDKRGVGESYHDGFDEATLRFEDYVADASGWLSTLKADNRFSKRLIIGHQEGALVAKLVALENSVSGVVSLAGASVPADEIILEQVENQPSMFPELSGELDHLKPTLVSVKKGEKLTHLPPSLQEPFKESVRGYLRSWFQYDPRPIASKLEVPFLVVQGTTDFLVLKHNGPKLAAANQNAQLVEIERMNHTLNEVGESVEDQVLMMSFPNVPLHKELVPAIVEFVNDLED